MPRTCTVCTHPQRAEIDAALVAGESFRYVAERYGTSPTALHRHKADHLPAALVRAQAAQEVAQADDLLAQVRELQQKASGILEAAQEVGDLKNALGAIRESRGCIELMAKLLGQLSDAPVVNVLVAPEWVILRGMLLEALQPFPAARVAVCERLEALEAPGGTRR